MAFKAKDGREFTNAPMMRQHERRMDVQKGAGQRPLPPKGKALGAQANDEQADASGDARQAVAEHGTAHEINIRHDHAAGTHSVESHHHDGHVHTSEHASAEEAHDAARTLGTDEGDAGGEDDGMGGNMSPSSMASGF